MNGILEHELTSKLKTRGTGVTGVVTGPAPSQYVYSALSKQQMRNILSIFMQQLSNEKEFSQT